MRWVNHKIITGSVTYMLTDNIVVSAIATAGSVFPDLVEGNFGQPGSKQYYEWRRRHRQKSHWFVPYLIIAVILLFLGKGAILDSLLKILQAIFETNSILHIMPYILTAIGFFFVGCLFHILEDSISGSGVPALNPKKRIGLRITSTGSLTEYAISFSILLSVVFLKVP